jgi:hypothetical protein
MRAFLRSLCVSDRMCIQDIEIDVRNLDSNTPHITREWLYYTASEKSVDCLRKDAVGLKCLRLNFEAWPITAMSRVELWNFLRNMLSNLRGLEQIVVTGASKRMNQKPPWSPVHFVGGDDVGTNDLLSRMSRSVLGRQEDKMIRWARGDGKLQLEVVSRPYRFGMGTQGIGPSWGQRHTDPWPLNGSCNCSNNEDGHADLRAEVNPSAVG